MGRMVLYTNIFETKAVFDNDILYICLSEKDGFSRTILTKSDNINFLEEYLAKAFNKSKIKIEVISTEEIGNI